MGIVNTSHDNQGLFSAHCLLSVLLFASVHVAEFLHRMPWLPLLA